jgi:predicted GIY-YIG superfamily endonuclease
MAAWAYMLRCADGSYYVGCTTDLDGRMGHHLAGTLGGYTSTRRPVEMVWAEEFQAIHDAIDAERRIKGWTRAKKAALIVGDWATITRWGSRAGRGASFETRSAAPTAPRDDEGE